MKAAGAIVRFLIYDIYYWSLGAFPEKGINFAFILINASDYHPPSADKIRPREISSKLGSLSYLVLVSASTVGDLHIFVNFLHTIENFFCSKTRFFYNDELNLLSVYDFGRLKLQVFIGFSTKLRYIYHNLSIPECSTESNKIADKL